MSFDERAYLDRLESASPGELTAFFRDPSPEQERALRRYFGAERYGRLQRLTLLSATRSVAPRGHVVVLPGIMGSELSTEARRFHDRDRIWLNFFRLALGQLDRLKLTADGTREVDERYRGVPSGVIKRYYAEPIVALSRSWNVHAFPYDWRKDLASQAERLKTMMDEWIPKDDLPVHFVAHSMGGLVVRMLSIEYPDFWTDLAKRGGEAESGRLIMLGTPNRGSFSIPFVLCGAYKRIKQLSCLDLASNRREMLEVTNSFPGTYQLLPSPVYYQKIDALYEASTYRDVSISETHLDRARDIHQKLKNAESGDVSRFVYVAGYGQETYSAIALDGGDSLSPRTPADAIRHGRTTEGDGQVLHTSGLFNDKMQTYYVDEPHGTLQTNASVLAALDELLLTGTTDRLPTEMQTAVKRSASDGEELNQRTVWAIRESREARDRRTVDALTAQVRRRSADEEEISLTPEQERAVGDVLGFGFVGGPQVDVQGEPTGPKRRPRVRIQLAFGDIGHAHELKRLPRRGSGKETTTDGPIHLPSATTLKSIPPVDALSVGHYTGVLPQAAEAALDRALRGENGSASDREGPLTRYARRGILRGDLAYPFMIPDPRDESRIVVAAGMGLPGRFGPPELVQSVRELVWAIQETGRSHLATVLIGSGAGNIGTERAVESWVRGLMQGVPTSSAPAGDGAAQEPSVTLTFVEISPRTLRAIDRAIQDVQKRLADRIEIDYVPWSEKDVSNIGPAEGGTSSGDESSDPPGDPAQTRVTVSRDGDVIRFGAITSTAAVPEIDVNVDARLVEDALTGLVEASTLAEQVENGQYVERLVLPSQLRGYLTSAAPVVLSLDTASARLHWEMFGLPDAGGVNGTTRAGAASLSDTDVTDRFLGTGRGLTRQLRTARPPLIGTDVAEDGVLRVLIIADPAEDARLPGADAEGAEVERLFRQFVAAVPDAGFEVEVDALIGPHEATRSEVMKALLLGRYDVVHYAGHCTFDASDVMASGWVFRQDPRELLTARELRRVERVPRFIVSNACESGVTQDRAGNRSPDLAPSFAESFFAQGVTNFVCTAWPIGDAAGLAFATTLYGELLGVQVTGDGTITRSGPPQPMYAAMREARRTAARASGGMTTWGAYQHYGDPYFRLRQLEDQAVSAAAPDANPSAGTVDEGDRKPRDVRPDAGDRVVGDAPTKTDAGTTGANGEKAPETDD